MYGRTSSRLVAYFLLPREGKLDLARHSPQAFRSQNGDGNSSPIIHALCYAATAKGNEWPREPSKISHSNLPQQPKLQSARPVSTSLTIARPFKKTGHSHRGADIPQELTSPAFRKFLGGLEWRKLSICVTKW